MRYAIMMLWDRMDCGVTTMAGSKMLKTLVPPLMLLTWTPAWAIDGDDIGAWTPEPGKCDFSGAGPFRITAKGLEEHEASCRIKRARRDGAGWSVQLSCASEGNTSNINLHWQILPNGHLKEISKEKVADFVRCP